VAGKVDDRIVPHAARNINALAPELVAPRDEALRSYHNRQSCKPARATISRTGKYFASPLRHTTTSGASGVAIANHDSIQISEPLSGITSISR
jgi:hypothetical protein